MEDLHRQVQTAATKPRPSQGRFVPTDDVLEHFMKIRMGMPDVED